jgi:hypothetical protein
MRLNDLAPQFLRHERRPDGSVHHVHVSMLAAAQIVMFLCPVCWTQNGGPVGGHAVICWSRSRGATEDAAPGPGRWALRGTGVDDLTLDGDATGGGGERSVPLTGPGRDCVADAKVTS